jgi:hypothetical protein
LRNLINEVIGDFLYVFSELVVSFLKLFGNDSNQGIQRDIDTKLMLSFAWALLIGAHENKMLARRVLTDLS